MSSTERILVTLRKICKDNPNYQVYKSGGGVQDSYFYNELSMTVEFKCECMQIDLYNEEDDIYDVHIPARIRQYISQIYYDRTFGFNYRVFFSYMYKGMYIYYRPHRITVAK